MIVKKILILGFIISLGITVFVVFFWDIPAPVKNIEKNLEIHRLNSNVKE